MAYYIYDKESGKYLGGLTVDGHFFSFPEIVEPVKFDLGIAICKVLNYDLDYKRFKVVSK